MAVVTQPGANQQAVLIPLDGNREWSSGLLNCCSDCGTMLCTCFCMPCLLCKLSTRLNECPLMWCCVNGSLVAMRTKVRTVGGIKGSICTDCVATTCCGPCAVCQLSREMDTMGL